MAQKVVLVAGASGFVGGAVIQRFTAAGWQVIGLSRRAPAKKVPGVEYRRVDLLDREACRTSLPDLRNVTHVVYAAVNETPGDLVASWTDPTHAARNGGMLEHLLDALLPAALDLQHVALVHGTKAYATHLANRPMVPLRESMPRPLAYSLPLKLAISITSASRCSGGMVRGAAPLIAGGNTLRTAGSL